MKQPHILSLILIGILLFATLSLLVSHIQNIDGQKDTVYVGVAFGGSTTAQAKLLIDRAKNYTNLFVLDSDIRYKYE